MAEVFSRVTATLAGKPIELADFSIATARAMSSPEPTPTASYNVSFDIKVDSTDVLEFLGSLTRLHWRGYWPRRQRFKVRQQRKRMARALGVSYADFLYFCHRGTWPRVPMWFRVDPAKLVLTSWPR